MQVTDFVNFNVLITSLITTLLITLCAALIQAWRRNRKMQQEVVDMKKKVRHLEDVRITKIENDLHDMAQKQSDVLAKLDVVAESMDTVKKQVDKIFDILLKKSNK